MLLEPVVLFRSADLPKAVFVEIAPKPRPIVIPLTSKSLPKVFAPAIVWAPVDSKPGFVPSAAVKVSDVPEIVPPAAYDVVEV